MDPHKRSVTIEVITAEEIVVGGGRFATDAEGCRQMLAHVAGWSDRVWTAPTRTIREVDRRSVINHRQARELLTAVKSVQPSGPRLVAFFGFMYYSALRPEGAANIRADDLELPPEDRATDWGALHLSGAAPHAGRNWTTDGSLRDTRALKHREQGDTRTAPMPPALVTIVRAHLDGWLCRIRAEVLGAATHRALPPALPRSASLRLPPALPP